MCLINPKSFEAETFSILFRVSESMRNKLVNIREGLQKSFFSHPWQIIRERDKKNKSFI